MRPRILALACLALPAFASVIPVSQLAVGVETTFGGSFSEQEQGILWMTFSSETGGGYVRPCVQASAGSHPPSARPPGSDSSSSASISAGGASAGADNRGREFNCWVDQTAAANLGAMTPFVSGVPVGIPYSWSVRASGYGAYANVQLFAWTVLNVDGSGAAQAAASQASPPVPEPATVELMVIGSALIALGRMIRQVPSAGPA